ncbi:MAG: hypothetical protein PHW95_02455 [Patescibacteria group bacterium]|nr:hypothetical protein [Patescibacteria group bacterium]
MGSYGDRLTEMQALVNCGFARDAEHAARILDDLEANKKHADLLILYNQPGPVRHCFGSHLVGENPYRCTNVLSARVPSGALSQAIKASPAMAFGALREFTSRVADDERFIDEDARLGAFVWNFPKPNECLFCSPFSADCVHDRGSMTIDEREGYLRLEFQSVAGDDVLGIFHAWGQQSYGDVPLVLYLSWNRVLYPGSAQAVPDI